MHYDYYKYAPNTIMSASAFHILLCRAMSRGVSTQIIHNDQNLGTTTAKKLWTDGRNACTENNDDGANVKCNCCMQRI